MARKHALLLVAAGAAAFALKKKKRKPSSEDEAAPLPESNEKSPAGEIYVFSAKWCGVCRTVEPKIRDIEKKHSDLKFHYIDIDDSPELAKEFDITGVPTFVAMQDGVEVDRRMGYREGEMGGLMKAAKTGEAPKALPASGTHLPVLEYGSDYMTGVIPTSSNYRPVKLEVWQDSGTQGITLEIPDEACENCAFAAEPRDKKGVYCLKWKTKVAPNYVCDSFEERN